MEMSMSYDDFDMGFNDMSDDFNSTDCNRDEWNEWDDWNDQPDDPEEIEEEDGAVTLNYGYNIISDVVDDTSMRDIEDMGANNYIG
jgi:hypothetical protein